MCTDALKREMVHHVQLSLSSQESFTYVTSLGTPTKIKLPIRNSWMGNISGCHIHGASNWKYIGITPLSKIVSLYLIINKILALYIRVPRCIPCQTTSTFSSHLLAHCILLCQTSCLNSLHTTDCFFVRLRHIRTI